MSELLLVFLGIQIPVIGLLFYLTREFSKIDGKIDSSKVALGWGVNSLIVILILLQSIFDFSRVISDDHFGVLIQELDLVMCGLFLLYSARAFGKFKEYQNKWGVTKGKLTLAYCFLLAILVIIEILFRKFLIVDILFRLIRAFCIGYLGYYYLKGTLKSRFNTLIYLGFGTYSSLQFFSLTKDILFEAATVTTIGWILSALAKILIALWLYRLIILNVNRKLQISVYEKILGLSLHESTPLIKLSYNEVSKRIIPAIDKSNKDSEFNRASVVKKLENLAIMLQRIRLIQEASNTIFKNSIDIQHIDELNLTDFTSKIESNNVKTVNVNRIIELSLLWHKRDHPRNKYTIKASYANNCYVRFYEVGLFQIFDNIIRNAEEATWRTKSKSFIIYVKTRVVTGEQFNQEQTHRISPKDESKKFVRIEFEDDGIGTSKDLTLISELGYSEKGDGRGYGLFIISKMIDHFNGYIFFESPAVNSIMTNPDRRKNRGFKVTILIPRI
ncbi:ATP-binding protein [Gilvibacter sediminis]|uniref:ATP-binding protein n=1 Tax=Gilvibacter sediminis TaxID=379071 RepID=UPI002350223A|nr:ATP-binding protein [Gilvibacter sediminis]MDC7996905.1 ATP-binding protein [Gilvibacter sediminis]